MRVLHVQRVKGIGGSERHLLTLLPALADAGLDVRMCALVTGDGDRFVDAMRGAGVDVVARAAGPDVNPALVTGLVSEIRRYRADIVHTHLVHADLHGQLAATLVRVPGVSSVHGTPSFYRREPYRSAGRVAGRLARRRIAISEHVASFLRENGLAPPDRIRLVYYGIDADRFAVDAPTVAATRDRFGIAPDDFIVGIASRLIPGKGHDVLIEAVGRAAPAQPHLHLLVAGDGPERARLTELAARCCPPDTVRFLGFVDDIRPLMVACDALAFPTQPELSEGFGLAALEAMAAGRATIASAVGSLPELVQDGVTGVLVEPRPPDELTRAILELAADRPRCARLGEEAARRARSSFTLESMVSRTIDVYAEVA